jgi:hypothetical protein
MDNYKKEMQALFDLFVQQSINGDEEGAQATSLIISQKQCQRLDETGEKPAVVLWSK